MLFFAGLNVHDVGTSTALLCALGTIAIGLLGNVPFALGPGMGLNTYVATMAVTLPIEQVMTVCFGAGVVTPLQRALANVWLHICRGVRVPPSCMCRALPPSCARTALLRLGDPVQPLFF